MTRPIASAAFGFATPLLLAAALPGLFDLPGLALQWPNVVVGAALAASLAIALVGRRRRHDAPEWPGVAAFAAAAAFGLGLALRQSSGVSSDVTLIGLLPSSDAQSYLEGAVAYLDLGRLTEWSTRRPFATLQLAGLLGLSGDSLRATLILLGAGCAGGALLVAAFIYQRFGAAAAAAAIASLYAFIHQTLGSTMTENLGFALGCAGFLLLASAAESRNRAMLLLGIALLSAALATRAGALFVLPLLALWCGWLFRATGRRGAILTIALALLAAAIGFLANKAVVIAIGEPGQLAFSNFSFTFYGLAVGGEPWTRFLSDHPQYSESFEGLRAMAAYQAAVDHIRAAPFDLIKGIGVRYNDFLINMGWHKYVPSSVLRMAVLLLALIGIADCWRRRGEACASLLLTGLAGILLSVPFLGDGGPRVFAATHGFSAAFVACGAASIARRFAVIRSPAPVSTAHLQIAGLAFAVLLLLPLIGVLLHMPRGAITADRPCLEDELALSGVMVARATICPPGAADCRGVRRNSVLATDIWKNPTVRKMAASDTPVQVGMIATPDARSFWLLGAGPLPLGERRAFCVKPEAGSVPFAEYRS